ncbi:PucR family transcriptional regulator [Rhodococcus erythropolis]
MVLALELLRQRTATEVEQRLRGELLADLLAGADPESRPIRDRANLMGHNLSVRHRMLVAVAMSNSTPPTVRSSTASEKTAERAASVAVRMTSQLRPRPLIAAVHDTVVALWPGDGTEQAGEQVMSRAIKMADSQATAKVITMQLSDSGIPDSYRVARGALSFATSDQAGPDSLTLDDLGTVGILLQFAEPAVLRRYANRILGAVDDYDAENGTNLVSTLRVYLDRDLDRRATAAHLVVHPNTVSQRLRRIEMLSGLDLRSPRSILDARSALMLLDVVRAIGDPVA